MKKVMIVVLLLVSEFALAGSRLGKRMAGTYETVGNCQLNEWSPKFDTLQVNYYLPNGEGINHEGVCVYGRVSGSQFPQELGCFRTGKLGKAYEEGTAWDRTRHVVKEVGNRLIEWAARCRVVGSCGSLKKSLVLELENDQIKVTKFWDENQVDVCVGKRI